jgi:sugar/nucleoside kinase (ribokinase family)
MTVLVVGDVMTDVVVRLRAPVAVGTDTPSEIVQSYGGSGANQAAWLGRLGVPVDFYGRVGAADAGRQRAALAGAGVAAHLAVDPQLPTGCIVVLVADDDRSMLTDRGANTRLSRADLPATLTDVEHLHVSGYALFAPGPREAVAALLAEARDRSIPFSVDPASESFLTAVGPANFLAWTAGATLCFPNLPEARLLAGDRAADPRTVATRLCRHYPLVAVTLGPAGTVVATIDDEPVHVRAPGVRVVDPTGAGDAFCAGFLAARLRGEPPAACGEAGAATAGLAVARLGARPD